MVDDLLGGFSSGDGIQMYTEGVHFHFKVPTLPLEAVEGSTRCSSHCAAVEEKFSWQVIDKSLLREVQAPVFDYSQYTCCNREILFVRISLSSRSPNSTKELLGCHDSSLFEYSGLYQLSSAFCIAHFYRTSLLLSKSVVLEHKFYSVKRSKHH